MRAREDTLGAEVRWKRLTLLQQHYKSFGTFLEDVMIELGFSTSDIQHDIGGYMEHGPQYLMVQAQRGQAKTTIAAAFAVWCLMHSPAHRVLIISAGGTQANEISTLIVRVVMSMDVLECMRPDKLAGDRTATDAFDIHHSLKGLDKSPSVACIGIDSNLQGKRADLLIADDIESTKNSATPPQRAKLLHLTKDFTSINSMGRILWLGTPQTMDSIYNSLMSRGVTIRIWPGRYPTPEQLANYGSSLAPLLLRRLTSNPDLGRGGGLTGNQGQPIDTVLLAEDALQKKERDQGEAYFQLQHMLNTRLSDAQRYPLKPELLVVVRGANLHYPMVIIRGMENSHNRDYSIADHAFVMRDPQETSRETGKLKNITAYIDPAAGGANGDETAYAVGGFLNGNVILLSVGGIFGGYEEFKLEDLAKRLSRFPLERCVIEKNMGFGAFRSVFTPIFKRFCTGGLDDDLVTGQKEKRIIATLAPVMGRGSLIIDAAAIDEDRTCCERYNAGIRQSYSLFFQIAKLTEQRDALLHDDRADAVEGMTRQFVAHIAQDQEAQLKIERDKELARLREDPFGHKRLNMNGPQHNRVGVSTLRHRRR